MAVDDTAMCEPSRLYGLLAMGTKFAAAGKLLVPGAP
jgi:hypothetical protein